MKTGTLVIVGGVLLLAWWLGRQTVETPVPAGQPSLDEYIRSEALLREAATEPFVDYSLHPSIGAGWGIAQEDILA